MNIKKSILLILFVLCGSHSYADVLLSPVEECCSDIMLQLSNQNILLEKNNLEVGEINEKIEKVSNRLQVMMENKPSKDIFYMDFLSLLSLLVGIVVLLIPLFMILKMMGKKSFLKKHCILLISVWISMILVVIFSFIHCISPFSCFFDIDTKWLIVAGMPILIGLILGGYVKRFKGLGIELDLRSPVPDSWFNNNERIVIDYDSGFDKGSMNELNRLDSDEKSEKKGLRLISNKLNYYKSEHLIEYLIDLPNLVYIEIISETREFECLIPFKRLEFRDKYIVNKKAFFLFANKLINALEAGEVSDKFPNIVDSYVLETDNKIDIYNKLSYDPQSRFLYPMAEVLPVLDRSKRMIGLINKLTISDKIAKEIIYRN